MSHKVDTEFARSKAANLKRKMSSAPQPQPSLWGPVVMALMMRKVTTQMTMMPMIRNLLTNQEKRRNLTHRTLF